MVAHNTLLSVWKSKFYGAFVLNHRVDLHAIDAAPARWRGDAGLCIDSTDYFARLLIHGFEQK